MSNLRIFLATLCLVYLATLSLSASASSDDDREPRGQYHIWGSHEKSEDDKNEEKNIGKKDQKKVKKTNKKIQKSPIKSQIGGVVPTKKTTSPAITPTKKTIPNSSGIVPITKSSTVTYRTPGGNDPVEFSVTVQSGAIISASSVVKAKNGTSVWYQESFTQNLSKAVVGKKITGLNLSAIGGASLTTRAFEQFVTSSF